MPFDCGLATGVKHGIRLRAWAHSLVSLAVYALPLSDRCSIACGALIEPKRFSTASNVMSRMSEPDIPALATAAHEIISRSNASIMNARRTTSPFQQVNSSPSEHQRGVDRITMA